jgi:transcriptional regulator with XRE-family HTH domain
LLHHTQQECHKINNPMPRPTTAQSTRPPPAANPESPPPDTALLGRYVGHAVREQRLAHRLTLGQVADRAAVSRSLLSKIENGLVSASLDTLARIAQALGVSMSALFKHWDVPEGRAQHVKSGHGMEVVRRGTPSGHTYRLLAYDQGPRKRFEPFLISIDDPGESFPDFEHPGTEFIHMLQGCMEYRHGQQVYRLQPGDSLTFSGQIPHGPGRLLELPIRFVTVIVYDAAVD